MIESNYTSNDSTYHILKNGLVLEVNNNIYLNNTKIGMALVGDTVIYEAGKIKIKKAYSE